MDPTPRTTSKEVSQEEIDNALRVLRMCGKFITIAKEEFERDFSISIHQAIHRQALESDIYGILNSVSVLSCLASRPEARAEVSLISYPQYNSTYNKTANAVEVNTSTQIPDFARILLRPKTTDRGPKPELLPTKLVADFWEAKRLDMETTPSADGKVADWWSDLASQRAYKSAVFHYPQLCDQAAAILRDNPSQDSVDGIIVSDPTPGLHSDGHINNGLTVLERIENMEFPKVVALNQRIAVVPREKWTKFKVAVREQLSKGFRESVNAIQHDNAEGMPNRTYLNSPPVSRDTPFYAPYRPVESKRPSLPRPGSSKGIEAIVKAKRPQTLHSQNLAIPTKSRRQKAAEKERHDIDAGVSSAGARSGSEPDEEIRVEGVPGHTGPPGSRQTRASTRASSRSDGNTSAGAALSGEGPDGETTNAKQIKGKGKGKEKGAGKDTKAAGHGGFPDPRLALVAGIVMPPALKMRDTGSRRRAAARSRSEATDDGHNPSTLPSSTEPVQPRLGRIDVGQSSETSSSRAIRLLTERYYSPKPSFAVVEDTDIEGVQSMGDDDDDDDDDDDEKEDETGEDGDNEDEDEL
ncbi:uncharacterized protein BXZ73DRAFT_99676 [Epithele typhae]|uniref:uncharacterized protein n=1 Tax=Epithele typhae TaxID=378194 RepID=UPI00200786A3|nr:uncharacterized protein BXZ73DRAFT_99676 [Epithele typhae]KAH9939001.1 hypothetical protein BXZ73DRAFT_99676 [Epithele typhae]